MSKSIPDYVNRLPKRSVMIGADLVRAGKARGFPELNSADRFAGLWAPDSVGRRRKHREASECSCDRSACQKFSGHGC